MTRGIDRPAHVDQDARVLGPRAWRHARGDLARHGVGVATSYVMRATVRCAGAEPPPVRREGPGG